MGVINVTPDSFSADGLFDSPPEAAKRAAELVEAGADVIDLGGESTRPGYRRVSAKEELRRVLPALQAIRQEVRVPISIDTSKAEVAHQALEQGASIVNDVSGLSDHEMVDTVAGSGASLICVHNRTLTPEQNIVSQVIAELERQLAAALAAGVSPEAVLIDPGFGFAKTWQQNLQILQQLSLLKWHFSAQPLVVGLSRKATIGRVLGGGPRDRVEGGIALNTVAIAHGADVLRVHDVPEMTRAARMADAVIRRKVDRSAILT